MTTPSDSIHDLSEEIRRFVTEREWDQFHDPKNLVMLLSSEVGELTAELRWIASDGADAYAQGDARERIQDETADVAIALLMLAARTKINLAAAVREKLAKNAEKYPVDLSRGRAERPR
jgi:NTP pyrophosphatase (non-canonical NTP hydrolase)